MKAPEQVLPVVLFALRPRGVLVPAHLEPLRFAVQAAQIELDALRRAAADAVSFSPVTSTEALRIDIHRHGPALAHHLESALRELEILTTAVREEAADAS